MDPFCTFHTTTRHLPPEIPCTAVPVPGLSCYRELYMGHQGLSPGPGPPVKSF